jgi:hypothetical protein
MGQRGREHPIIVSPDTSAVGALRPRVDLLGGQRSDGGAAVACWVEGDHAWRLGRIIDPFGLEREIGTPLVGWPAT